MSAMQQPTANTDGELREAIATLGLGTPPTDSSAKGAESIASSLEHFLDLMLRWNRVYNLTAITDRAQMITHHLVDSLAIVPTLDGLLAGQTQPRLLDVGTGAGLPGIALAVARPHWQLTLVDSNSKKTAFVTQAVAELGLTNVDVDTGRVEQQRSIQPRNQQSNQARNQQSNQARNPQSIQARHQQRIQPRNQPQSIQHDVIVSRAFASLGDFVSGTRHLLAHDGTWVAMKGVVPHAEIEALPNDVECAAIVPLDVPGLDAERHLILMKAKR